MTDAELKTKIAVLVVDDSAVMRRILATVLEKDPEINVIGFASNGLEAIEAVARLKPQVVTLDIEMPKLDGIAALKEIRKFAPRLPVIMFSTLTQSGARAAIDALMSGASDYVGKPDASQGMEGAFTVLQQVLIPKIKGLIPASAGAACAGVTPTHGRAAYRTACRLRACRNGARSTAPPRDRSTDGGGLYRRVHRGADGAGEPL